MCIHAHSTQLAAPKIANADALTKTVLSQLLSLYAARRLEADIGYVLTSQLLNLDQGKGIYGLHPLSC